MFPFLVSPSFFLSLFIQHATRSVDWLVEGQSNRNESIIQVKSKSMNAQKRKDPCMLCFSIFLYFIVLYVSFFSISQLLSIIVYLLLSIITVYNGTKMATVCVLYAVTQFHNRYFVHRFVDSSTIIYNICLSYLFLLWY